ncbi:hypothetical protein ABZW10_36400 [Kitasatospora sp. NPDC004723]|uniref:hypothetical protein n=1 Tax=Kitasatospora sp. NPDC004723 TaxID=3154288 RepID=UPI0033B5FB36
MGEQQVKRKSGSKRAGTFGPVQFPDRLGVSLWQFERARRAGLVPEPDAGGGRWSVAVVEEVMGRRAQIAALGALPDVGAERAAGLLGARFGMELEAGVLIELARTDVIPVVGEYKGHALYCGRALETFADRAVLERAVESGRLYTRVQAAGYLRVREADFAHLVRSGWVEPVTWVRSGWQRRREVPAVALFRQGDLEVLLAHPGIDWDEVRRTPKGRPSQLARLTTRTGRGGE